MKRLLRELLEDEENDETENQEKSNELRLVLTQRKKGCQKSTLGCTVWSSVKRYH